MRPLPLPLPLPATPSRRRPARARAAPPLPPDGAAPLVTPPLPPSPLELAELRRGTADESATVRLVLDAAAPWSPATHGLWPPAKRRRARELLVLGQQLSLLPLFAGEEQAAHISPASPPYLPYISLLPLPSANPNPNPNPNPDPNPNPARTLTMTLTRTRTRTLTLT